MDESPSVTHVVKKFEAFMQPDVSSPRVNSQNDARMLYKVL
jgi:hypothetical protein